jgi:hypothetical protein
MNKLGAVICWTMMGACLIAILLFVGAYNDIGPLRFIGGYPGFPEAGSPGIDYNPSSAQVVGVR